LFLLLGRGELNDLLEVYDADDVCNLDKTVLFYLFGPNSTFASSSIFGLKRTKERIAIATCFHASGTDTQKPFVIGKFAKHWWFSKP